MGVCVCVLPVSSISNHGCVCVCVLPVSSISNHGCVCVCVLPVSSISNRLQGLLYREACLVAHDGCAGGIGFVSRLAFDWIPDCGQVTLWVSISWPGKGETQTLGYVRSL